MARIPGRSIGTVVVAVVTALAFATPLTTIFPSGPTRLDLHVTSGELDVWRARAAAGPYRTAGDAGVGSPGDWERIEQHRDEFLTDPARSRWAGPPAGPDCVEPGGDGAKAPDPEHLVLLRDTAFHALVTSDAGARARAADELYAQSRAAGLEFADRTRWCLGTIWDLNPGFEIAGWLTSLLYAFEYIEIGDRLDGSGSLTEEQRRELLDWLYAAATWMNDDTNTALAKNFTDRSQRDEPPYTLSPLREEDPAVDAPAFDGSGDAIGAIARYYNNRRAQQQRFVGLLGLHIVHRDDGYRPTAPEPSPSAEVLVADATRFAKDYLVYSVYPEGFTGEFHRATERLPDLGWGYAMAAVAPILTFADAAARTGDRRILELVTRDGAHGSEGTPAGEPGKHYRWLVTELLGYLDGTHDRYLAGHPGDPAFRIDGVHDALGWYAAHDAALSPVLGYWDDDRHAAVIRRTAPSVPPWPEDPAGFGEHDPWSGDWGTLPGVLFQFVPDDDQHDPYPTPGAG